MKPVSYLALLMILYTCNPVIPPVDITFSLADNQWPNTDIAKMIDPLDDLILHAESSVECAFSDLDVGFPSGLESLNHNARNRLQNLASHIIDRKNESLDISLVFDARQQCRSTGPLYLKNPSAFSDDDNSGQNFKTLISECENRKVNYIESFSGITFTKNSSAMNNNFCVIDKNKIWFSLVPLSISDELQGVSFIFNPDVSSIDNTFVSELDSFKDGLSGKLKTQQAIPHEYVVHDSKWRILRGPQDDPLSILAQNIETAENVYLFSSEMVYKNFSSNFPVQNVLLEKIRTGQDIQMVFSGSHLFNEDSFVHNTIKNDKTCQENPEFCSNHIFFNPRGHVPFQGHLFLITDINGKKKSIFFNGNLDENESKNSDSLMVEIDSDEVYGQLMNIWQRWKSASTKLHQVNYRTEPGEVIINEIVWMGSINNSGSKKSSDEAVEIFNTTDHEIDIGGLVIACTKSSTGDSVSDLFLIPEGVFIQPHQYLSIASRDDGAFASANIIQKNLSLANSNRECLLVDPLTDNQGAVNSFYPAGSLLGHYNHAGLTGRIIDKVLDFHGDPWNRYAGDFFSRTGLNRLVNDAAGYIIQSGVRSMERIAPSSNGSLIKSWHMNTQPFYKNPAMPDYVYYTMTTLGYENSMMPLTSGRETSKPASPGVVINEIHWMGSYDRNGVSRSSDEFVEFYNASVQALDIGGWIFGCATDLTGTIGKPLFGFPYGTRIDPGQYLVFQNEKSVAFIKYDLTFSYSLNNSITECLLTDGSAETLNFRGSDNGDGSLDGHYDNPLFLGSVIDVVSDRSATYAQLGLGLNDTSNKIRRSCERVRPDLPGNLPSSWKINSFIDASMNTGIEMQFRENTFATPGNENSK